MLKVKKNQFNLNQLQQIKPAVFDFYLDTKSSFDPEKCTQYTLRNIVYGCSKQADHDTWVNDGENLDFYVLCKKEIDADGERVYTAYQLWIKPELRNLHLYKQIIRLLRFYTQKQGFKRLYLLSSRLDKIKAYQRGIGYSFKPKYVTFAEEY